MYRVPSVRSRPGSSGAGWTRLEVGAAVAHDDSAAMDDRPTAGAGAAGHGDAPRDYGDALRDHGELLAWALRRAPFGVALTSLAGGRPTAYVAVNDMFCQLTGYSRRELAGGDFLGDVHPEDQPVLESLLQQVSAGAGQIRADARMVRMDGEVLLVQLTAAAVEPPVGGRCLAIFIEDGTGAERARAEILRLDRELQHSHRLESLGQLVGGIAHDFSNLLAVIANHASLVHDEVSAAEVSESASRWEPVRWDVEKIEDAADRATRLIKQLVAFARRETAGPVPLDLSLLVNDVSRLLGQVLGDHVQLVIRPRAELWPVLADPAQFEQAIINIAVNARDAMPSGGQVAIDTANIDTANIGTANIGTANIGTANIGSGEAGRVTSAAGESAAGLPRVAGLADLPPGRYVQLRIADTGTGMDAMTAGRAFDPFFTTKGGDQVAGLGLSAVRRFAAQAGGTAWLRSEPGKGTTVTVMLPAAPGAGSGLASAAAAEDARVVLVVDDEAAIRDVAHRVLTRAGYRVVTAANGPEALDLLGDPGLHVDVLLADVVMPGMTANVFAAEAQARCPGLRVLFMSGYERPSAVPDGWPDSGAEVLDKPFSRAMLLAKINQLLTAGPAAGRPEPAGQGAHAVHSVPADRT